MMFNLRSLLLENRVRVENWLTQQWQGRVPPIYCSVDIRNAGFKMAHVDTNLFPAGFNNVHPARRLLVKQQLSDYLTHYWPQCSQICLVGEDFTRNNGYLTNLNDLEQLLARPPVVCKAVPLSALQQIDGVITIDGWLPDLLVLNTDLTAGIPGVLQGIRQPIIPAPRLGWHSRSKHHHFVCYQKFIDGLAEELSLDPWLLSTYHNLSKQINFREKLGIEELADLVNDLLSKINSKYQQYKITSVPYVFVKIDNGTFGAGVMTAYSADDIINISKKSRHSMHKVRQDGAVTSQIMVQEGVPTVEQYNSKAAEYVYYLIAGEPSFSILRYNSYKDQFANLNSRGMGLLAQEHLKDYAAGVIAQIAALATTDE